MHHNIARAPGPLGVAVEAPMGGIPGFVYRSIRDTARITGLGIDLLGAAISPLLAPAPSSPRREAILAALNGVLGDHLAFSANPLAIPMSLRRGGVALELTPAALAAAIPRPRSRVIVLVHGLCFNDLQWLRQGHDHGAALAAGARPATELYLHYNSGRHIATNGRELAELLDTLAGAWPLPLEEIDLIGHSMGGLVMRSAFAHASAMSHQWLARLRTVTFLGTPHAGAPLERGGHRLNVFLEESPYTIAFAQLGRIRSAGIKDLRHGDADDPLPAGVACYAIAGSLARRPGSLRERVLGDGLVPLDSALGRKAGPGGGELFAPSNQAIAYGVGHLGLLNSKKVYRTLRGWLAK
jgi:pimeloyl-ACP methyl ester carboxylesterase